MTRQQLYAALSRGRADNHVHVKVEQQLDVDVERAPDARADSAETLRQIIARDGAERSATETLREEVVAPHRLDSLVPQYVHAVEMQSAEQQQAKRDALAGVFGQQQTAALLAEPAGDALLAELSHHPDMATAIATAAAERELGSAKSPAQVMQWRLEKLRNVDAEGALAGPLPWLPTVPAASTGELWDWAVSRAQVIGERARDVAELVDAERPQWAAPLGGRPAEPAAARDWDRAAALAAAYRKQFKITDESSVLGSEQATKGTQGSRLGRRRRGGTDRLAVESQQDVRRPIAAAPSDVAVSVRERSRNTLQSELSGSEVVLRALVDEQQHRLQNPEHAVADTVTPAELSDLSELEAARSGGGTRGRAWTAGDEPARVGSLDMSSEEAAQEPAEPRPYATVSDRELAVRLSDIERAVTVTGGQLDAMARKDSERTAPLAAATAKIRERVAACLAAAVQRVPERVATADRRTRAPYHTARTCCAGFPV